MLNNILKTIGIAEPAIRIYQRLLEVSHASARDLAEHFNMPRASVYDYLRILLDHELIIEQNEEGKTVFARSDPKNIQKIFTTRIDALAQEQKKLSSILPTLAHHGGGAPPTLKVYRGAEGIRHVLRDILWYERIEIVSIWPFKEMVQVLGQEFFAEFNQKRIRRNIAVRGLWPRDQEVLLKNYPFMGVGGRHLRQVRVAPKGMTWAMGHSVYEDKVGFISSHNEGFGCIIQSKDFAQLMKVQFECMWGIRRPLRKQNDASDAFLKTI